MTIAAPTAMMDDFDVIQLFGSDFHYNEKNYIKYLM